MIHQRTRLLDDKSSTNTAGMRGKSKRLENGKEPKKTQKQIPKKYKIGRLANKNWNRGKLKLFSNNKLKKECWCQVGDDAERV
jgi:hypothetical protein